MAAIVGIERGDRGRIDAAERPGVGPAASLAAAAAMAERARIAHDLHDSLGQSIKGLGLRVAAHAAEARDVRSRRAFEELLGLVDEADKELRLAIAELLFERAPDEELASAIRRRCDDVAARSGLRIVFEITGCPHPLGRHVEQALVRVVAEALANVERHAHAAAARVELAFGEAAVSVSVRDDGVGWSGRSPECVPGRFGIATMRRRVEAIGGRVTVRRARPRGVLVEAVIPGRKVTAHATGSGGGRR